MSRITIGKTCWKFNDFSLGSIISGGYLICKSGGVGWIVSSASDVQRSWYCRNDAITVAQAAASCGDWFIPSCDQLKNPGYTCSTYWNPECLGAGNATYWSNTERDGPGAWSIGFTFGLSCRDDKPRGYRVRAFRCVTY